MEEHQRIKEVLEETEILRFPDKLIFTTKPTTLHYYVLAKPYYLDYFKNEGPETKVREGNITWEKPKLLTPGYILKMEGFSDRSKDILRRLAQRHPDLAGLLYKLKYKKEFEDTRIVSKDIENTFHSIDEEINDDENTLTVIIKGVDEYWDVSLMKFIQDLMIKSAFDSQMSDYANKGYIRMDDSGRASVTRNLEGLPLAAREDIEKMFTRVKKGDMNPSKLKNELDQWGVYSNYEDRFLDLFRKE